jgi:hypothetical protein
MNVTIKENREEDEASHPCIQEWGTGSGCASIWNRILEVVVRIGLYLDPGADLGMVLPVL